MSIEEKEKLQGRLEAEISVVNEMNKKLGEEVEKCKKELLDHEIAFKKIVELINRKTIGTAGATRLYMETIKNELNNILKGRISNE